MVNDLISRTYVMMPPLNPKGWAWGASGLMNTCANEMQETVELEEGMEFLHPFPIPPHRHLFHLAVSELYPFITHQ